MPTTFFDLPRELRDIIYAQTLISPTGHVVPMISKCSSPPPGSKPYHGPIPRGSSPSPLRKPSRQLQLMPCTPSCHRRHRCGHGGRSSCTRLQASCIQLDGAAPLTTNLALASRQAHAETAELVWQCNTVCFVDGTAAVRILRAMGQRRSTRLVRVQLHVDALLRRADEHAALAKALSMLASRARRGALRHLELCIDRLDRAIPDVVATLRARSRDPLPPPPSTPLFDTALVDALLRNAAVAAWSVGGGGGGGTRVVRKLVFDYDERGCPKTSRDPALRCDAVELMQIELHHAWGGLLLSNGKLVWDDSCRAEWRAC